MSYTVSELTFPSKDGLHNVYAEIYLPADGAVKGIIEIVHGMIDYTARYKNLVEYFTACGYAVAGHHHLGHGKTASTKEDFGFFASKDGVDFLVRDTHTMNRILRERYPDTPIYMLGHSMGSFVTRLYVNRYPYSIKGAIIHGTGGPNPLLPLGRTLARLIRRIYGEKHISSVLEKLSIGGYNSKFPKSEGENAWLTRELSQVENRSTDEFTSFKFTTSGYIDLFELLGKSNSKEWFKSYPEELPTLVISGEADPVGNFGKGPEYVYKQLLISGCSKVELKLYKDARHELFNETNRIEVFSDLLEWIEKIK